MRLKYGNFKETNDPTEFIRYTSVPYSPLVQMDKSLVFEPFYSKIHTFKLLCFSKDGDNRKGWQLPCMWAHYGDDHKGVCIELDLDKIKLNANILHNQIYYTESIPISFFLDERHGDEKDVCEIVDNYVKENIKTLFFNKELDWSNEQEYRLISDSKDVYLDIRNAISGIYFGARCDINKKPIKSLLNDIDLLGVEIYNMAMKRDGKFQNLGCYDVRSYKEVERLNKEILIKLKAKKRLLNKV